MAVLSRARGIGIEKSARSINKCARRARRSYVVGCGEDAKIAVVGSFGGARATAWVRRDVV